MSWDGERLEGGGGVILVEEDGIIFVLAFFMLFSSTDRNLRNSSTQQSGHALIRTFQPFPNSFFFRRRM
jgi:hypothetical protein